MGDKIDELFEILGNNKKTFIIILVVYVIVMLVLLVAIWWPKEKEYATYQQVDIEERKEIQAKRYLNTLLNMLKNNRTEDMENLISNRYVRYTQKSSKEIVNDLVKAGYFSSNVEVKGMNIYTDGDTYVYSTTIYSGNNKRNINIIERYPYNYEIVFDDFYSYEESEIAQTVKNIKFTAEKIYRNLKYIEIDMKMENLNDTYARFDFTSTVGVQAVLDDGTKYSLANLISGETYTNIEANTTVNKNFVFEIPAQLQNGIKYIVFNGVSIGFSQSNLQVSI